MRTLTTAAPPRAPAEAVPKGSRVIFCRVLRQRDRLLRRDFVEPLKGPGAPSVMDAVSRLNGQALVRRGAKAQEARADRTGAARVVGGTEAARPCRCGRRQPAAATAGRFAARDSVVLRRCRRLRRLGGARSIPDAARTGATAQPLFCRGRDAARRCDRKRPSSATVLRMQSAPCDGPVAHAGRCHTQARRARDQAPWPALPPLRAWAWCHARRCPRRYDSALPAWRQRAQTSRGLRVCQPGVAQPLRSVGPLSVVVLPLRWRRPGSLATSAMRRRCARRYRGGARGRRCARRETP